MGRAQILIGVSVGISLLAGSLAAMAATGHGAADAARRPQKSVMILSGVALLLIAVAPVAAFSGEPELLKFVLLATGAFAVAGAAFGLRATLAGTAHPK